MSAPLTEAELATIEARAKRVRADADDDRSYEEWADDMLTLARGDAVALLAEVRRLRADLDAVTRSAVLRRP